MQELGIPLHALVHVASHTSGSFSLTEDGYESHFGVNCLAPLLLTRLLLPLMVKSVRNTREGSIDGTTAPAANQPGWADQPAPLIPPSQQQHLEYIKALEASEGSSAVQGTVAPPVGRVIWASCSAHHIVYLPARWVGQQQPVLVLTCTCVRPLECMWHCLPA
jgi:NAD(P)-dependent dehydrogenase (short-subunit alcohol dehydrogenase family)